jgi:hypothetical protein
LSGLLHCRQLAVLVSAVMLIGIGLEKEGTKIFYMYNHLQTVIYNYKRLKTE